MLDSIDDTCDTLLFAVEGAKGALSLESFFNEANDILRLLFSSQLLFLASKSTSQDKIEVKLLGEIFSLHDISLLGVGELFELEMGEKSVVELAAGVTTHLLFLLLLGDQLDHLVQHIDETQLLLDKLDSVYILLTT